MARSAQEDAQVGQSFSVFDMDGSLVEANDPDVTAAPPGRVGHGDARRHCVVEKGQHCRQDGFGIAEPGQVGATRKGKQRRIGEIGGEVPTGVETNGVVALPVDHQRRTDDAPCGLLGIHGKVSRILKKIDTKHWKNNSPESIKDDAKRHASLEAAKNVTLFLDYSVTSLEMDGKSIASVDAVSNTEHKKIRIKLHTGDPEQATARVLAGEEQVSIGARPERLPAGLAFKPIAVSPLVFIAPKNEPAVTDLLKSPMPASQWEKVPMIVPERGVVRSRVDAWFASKQVPPDYAAQVAGNEAIVSMVSLGSGVGVVPGIVLDNSPLAEKVQVFPARPDLAPLELGLFVLNKRLQNRLIRAFWATVPSN